MAICTNQSQQKPQTYNNLFENVNHYCIMTKSPKNTGSDLANFISCTNVPCDVRPPCDSA